MRPLAIRARNLRTWAELDLEVPAGVVAIVGPNGAGKSSLVEVIDLALFGTGKELGRATTRGLDDVDLSLVFAHDGDTYHVRRGRRKGKPTLELFRRAEWGPLESWDGLTLETITATQESLEELLGLSRQTFRASSFLAQGDGAAFTMAEPRERKAILLDALGVRVWDRLKAKATEWRVECEEAGQMGYGRREALEGVVAGLGDAHREHEHWTEAVSRWREKVAELEAELAEARERAELEAAVEADRRELAAKAAAAIRRMTEAHFRAKELRTLVGNGRLTESARTELAAKIAKAEPATKVLELEATHEKLQPELARLEALEVRLGDEGERLSERTDALVEELDRARDELRGLVECPTCGQRLDEQAKRRASEALRARVRALEDEQGEAVRRAAEAREEAARLAEERYNGEAAARGLLVERMKLTELVGPNAASTLADARVAERELAVLEERAAGLIAMREEADRLEAELPALEAEAIAFDEALLAMPTGSDARERVATLEHTLAGARPDLAEFERSLARAEEALRRITEAKGELDILERELGANQDRLELLRLAERAYGRDGIPALILETSAIPHLEAEANRIVAELGREYRFELRTQRETQAGTQREALDVVVHTEGGEALYEDFSGGERTRLDLSLRIALARLLAARRGADVRILAIDEPAFLDDEGFEQLAKVLAGLEGEFETILVVSHVDALRDAFDSAIIVGGGADTGEPSRLEEVTA